jgi:hypothetical protein
MSKPDVKDNFSRCAGCGHLELVHDAGRCKAHELTENPCNCAEFVVTSLVEVKQ